MGKLVIPSIVASGIGTSNSKAVALLSITVEPVAPFAKGSKYYNSTTKKIYTAVEADTWVGAKESDPSFSAYYTYNGKAYTWDGNSLELFELEDYQLIADKVSSIETYKTSTTKYPNTKAVYDYFVAQGTARNFIDASITKTTSSYTFLDLAEEIRGKQFATGTTLYGEVRNSGLPTNVSNAEIRVEILETKDTVNPSGSNLKSQVIEFTLFSTDVEPKEWSFIYYDQRNITWTWISKAVPTNSYNTQATTTVPTSKALYDALANIDTLPSQTGNAGKSLTTNGTNASWQNIEQIKEQNNNALIKIWYGNQAQYDAISNLDPNTDYRIIDDSSVTSTLLATQQEFNSGVQNKAATPAQVKSLIPTLTWYTGNTGTTITIVDTTNALCLKIYKNGILLEPTTDYTASGTTLTLTTTVEASDKITVEIIR